VEPKAGGLRFVERVRATNEVHADRLHPEARRFVPAAVAAAVALHALAALATLPRASKADLPPGRPVENRDAGYVHAVVPLPPPRATSPPRAVPPAHAAPAVERDVAAPPDAPVEPWLEPGRETEFAALPGDAASPLGVPEPPAAGPSAAQQGAVTSPVVIPESRVQPAYPARAHRLGIPGSVMLDVSVLPDGTVGEISVLRCDPPDQGFCESAVRAVKRWRYVPGLVGDRPAQVSVKVSLEFKP